MSDEMILKILRTLSSWKSLSSYLFSFYFAFKYDREIPLPVVTVASRALAEKCVINEAITAISGVGIFTAALCALFIIV